MRSKEFPDFANMNETDVREEIVRPLITRLGYRHGAEAYVQTELTLSYSAAFLGRKNPKKDPPLQGRADYVCGVVAAGRWVVEVKGPNEDIGESTVQQAHTYAAHPEVAAHFFMVTNCRNFRLFETGRLDAPLLEWSFAETEETILKLSNIVGVDAIRKRAKVGIPDPGHPLGHGLHSQLEILNGKVVYTSHSAGQIKFMASLDGLELAVSGGQVSRNSDGRIHARVRVASVSPLMKIVGGIGSGDQQDFYSSDRYISTDQEQPTIFQNFIESSVHQGAQTSFVGMQGTMPCSMNFSAFTEVVGFVQDLEFQGTMRIEMDMTVGKINPLVQSIMQSQFGITAGTHHITQVGRFNARLAPNLN